ncbi:MAG: DUF1287 domain-containing protein [Clostridia bacterium]|nr:DUF1287 domain-containing protein [Clostridia bacterium]
MKNKKYLFFVFAAVLLIIAVPTVLIMDYYNLFPQKAYSADDFGIKTVESTVDFDGDGVDDYRDIMLGARQDAENKPKYKSEYYANAFPPDNIGVCTDVVWRAFKAAGYDLRAMVSKDISQNTKDYPNVQKPDDKIDFRRVKNLKVFFDKYATVLTTDTEEISEWQPGDIVIFNNNTHIGVVSDKRSSDGKPYIIHNGGQPNREEDYLPRTKVVAHYRFDASLLLEDFLEKWQK